VVGIGLATEPIGLLAAYLAIMAVHGRAIPVHQGMLHRAIVGPSTRATVVSANSLTAQTGGALGGIALGALADATSLTTANPRLCRRPRNRGPALPDRGTSPPRCNLTTSAREHRRLETRSVLPHHRTAATGHLP
jgi:hypothetical protein